MALLCLVLSTLAILPTGGEAQAVRVEVAVENDVLKGFLPGRRTSDREYTHGMWFAVERSDAPGWGRLLPRTPTCGSQDQDGSGCLMTRVEVGQAIFTPDLLNKEPSAAERPFAGWLYAGVTGRRVKPRGMRSLGVVLGVTGAPSLAATFQRGVHRLVDLSDPDGWEHQLPFEPGLLIRYGEARLLELDAPVGGRIADLVLSADASVGNLRTGLGGDATGRIGWRIPHPWRPSTRSGDGEEAAGGATPGFALFVIGGLRQNYTLHDLFLDGSTFRNGPRVERRPFTGAREAGVGMIIRSMELRAMAVSEDRLYRTQPKPHLYHSLRIIVHH